MRAVKMAGIVLVAAALGAAGALADVRLEVLPDGGKVVHNRGDRPRRALPRLALGSARPERRLGDTELEPIVRRHALVAGLDQALVRAVIAAESGFNAAAVSRKGAMGLMQLMPDTARELAVADPFDPDDNVRGGTAYLRRLMDRFGRLDLALAAYNAGPETIDRYGGLPPFSETRRYVERVLGTYRGRPVALPAASATLSDGRPTYLYRDADGRLIMTTNPPGR